MSAAIIFPLIRAELALSVAILLVLTLRRPIRRAFGALPAYLLWLAVPLCVIASLLPALAPAGAMAPVVSLAADAAWQAKPLIRKARHVSDYLLAAWALGALVTMALFAVRQIRFVRGLGRLVPSSVEPTVLLGQPTGSGPMLLGALRPRIVAPADFEARFRGPARDLVLAHERVHLMRGDAFVNMLVVIVRCLAWFNPLAHLAASALRVDQEIACDAAVVERHPDASRLYAETLLGTWLTPLSTPFGCHWPAVGEHPLKERLKMLQIASTPRAHKRLGALLAGTLGLAAAGAVWAANPPSEPTITNPVWVQRPSREDVARYYPQAAIQAGVIGGKAVMDCAVTGEGRLENCRVRQQDPPEQGFGEAAIQLSRHFQMAAEDRDGKPTAGGVIRLPIALSHASN